MSGRRRAVVAIGGNSLIKDKQHQSVRDQYIAAGETCWHIVSMIEEGWDVAIGHGNGPQVGFILRRSELAAHELHEVPLDVCGADSQGAIGYALAQNLENDFRRLGMDRHAVAVVTQVEVAADDPAFEHPTKPIGSFMDEPEAMRRKEEDGWAVVDDANRGWRRVVASPQPLRIVEEDAIKRLLDEGFVVVSVGGGGIPVVALVTQTLVDKRDPAFTHPDKPVGSFMDEATARRFERELGWSVMQDGDRGWRRCVASPQPLRIIESPIIGKLARDGALVIACGGGGIAVERTAGGALEGVEAVIDKDRASALLAIEMNADLLMIPTGVERVAIRFGKPDQQWLDRIDAAQAERYAAEGHFGAGSMQPKIEALLTFVKGREGGRGVITNPESIARALRGETGTWIER